MQVSSGYPLLPDGASQPVACLSVLKGGQGVLERCVLQTCRHQAETSSLMERKFKGDVLLPSVI